MVKVYNNSNVTNGVNNPSTSANETNNKTNTNTTTNNANNNEDKTDSLNTHKVESLPNVTISSTTNLSSPINLITNAGCTTTVLAVSGISTNLLMNPSALGLSQLANLNTLTHTNNNVINGKITNNMSLPTFNKPDANQNTALNTDHTNGFNGFNGSSQFNSAINKQLKTLDFCYYDETKFTIIDAINLCVTVVAYASNANRANQMLVILDVIIPRYLNHIKTETDKIQISNKSPRFKSKKHAIAPVNETTQQARIELSHIQKISISIKNLVNASDFLTRSYGGPKVDKIEKIENLSKNPKASAFDPSASIQRSSNRSPSIMPDDDSK